MKAALAFAASTWAELALGLSLQHRRDGMAARVVGMTTERRHVANPTQRDRLRRRGAVAADLDNEETLYFINATLGTPPQSLRLHIDTGSSDLWVNTASSVLCQSRTKPCSYAGTYTANSSSTYEYVGSYFNISYVDGSGASGDYVADTVSFGDNTTLARLQFGIGYSSSSSQGILGIGYAANEVQVGRAGRQAYNNLPAQLAADGQIASNAYSLWLNDLDANTGSILFGGVDTDQYVGQLQTLPVQKQAGAFSEFLVTLTGLQLGSATLADDLALAVLLDSGSSLTYLPDSTVETLYSRVGASYDSSEGAAYVECSLARSNTSLTFAFSGVHIAVGMDELVLDLFTTSGKRPQFQNGQDACLFGVAPAGSSTNVLGDTFLRSAYVVYDLSNNEISLAQTNFNATSTNVLEIAAGTTGVPDATAVSNAVSATQGLVILGDSSAARSAAVRGAPSAPAALAVLVAAASLVAGWSLL